MMSNVIRKEDKDKKKMKIKRKWIYDNNNYWFEIYYILIWDWTLESVELGVRFDESRVKFSWVLLVLWYDWHILRNGQVFAKSNLILCQ